MLNERLQESQLIPARATNRQQVWDAVCSSWIGVFGSPLSIQMDEGGERKDELWTELRCDGRIKLLP